MNDLKDYERFNKDDFEDNIEDLNNSISELKIDKSQELLNELNHIKDQLSHLDIAEVKNLMNNELKDDRDLLLEKFNEELSNLPKNNNVKLNALLILANMGIYPEKLHIYDLNKWG